MSPVRSLALLIPALAIAAPVAAQFKVPKKVKEMTGAEKAKPAAVTDAGDGSALVLDDQVIEQIIKGLRAREARKAAATKEDTPYGRYHRGKAAYVEAKAKCDAAMQAYPARVAADLKLAEKNGERTGVYTDSMIAAQQKGDTAAQRRWGDSMALIYDPACAVKEPQQPQDYYELQRAVNNSAEEASLESSGLDRREMGAAVDRAIAILEDHPPPDLSPSEEEAVAKRERELKELMGLTPPPQARAQKPTPPPPPAPAPEATGAGSTSGQQAMGNCMAKNARKHEKAIQRLSEKAAAAANANDIPTAMAYADSINRLQMAGCDQ